MTAGLLCLCLVVLIALWLTVVHIPGWYQPATFTEEAGPRIRADVARFVDDVSDQVAEAELFEVVLREDQINDWLAALPHLWPELEGEIPSALTAPAVHLSQNELRFGAHFEDGPWEAILNTTLRMTVADDGKTLTFTVTSIRAGSLPAPRTLLDRFLAPLLRDARTFLTNEHGRLSSLPDIDSIDELFTGVTVRNRFVWPNGKRPFRIDSLTIEPRQVRLRIEPL